MLNDEPFQSPCGSTIVKVFIDYDTDYNFQYFSNRIKKALV